MDSKRRKKYWQGLGLTLALCATAAQPALQSRPPGLQLTGPHLSEMEQTLEQARRTIAQNRLTKGTADGPAARDLLDRVLTADPFNREALELMQQLIGALTDWGRGRLDKNPPQLQGARAYWTSARDLALRYGVVESTEQLDRLRLAIEETAREQALAQLLQERDGLQAELEHLRSTGGTGDYVHPPQRDRPSGNRGWEAAREQANYQSRPAELALSRFGLSALRSTPADNLERKEVETRFAELGLFSSNANPRGPGISNRFQNNRDGTVTDHTTGLMWEIGGSQDALSYREARRYIRHLQLAGHGDWRLPTLEEAASLLEPERANGLHIDRTFDPVQTQIWTADRKEGPTAWQVAFGSGKVGWGNVRGPLYVRGCRSAGQ